MNILHISDLHFGPRHWEGDDQMLLDKINSYNADIVINTGDNTTDGLEDEYLQAGSFLKAIRCKNVISTIGNHDKRNMRSHELFQKYIYDSERISILQSAITRKKHLFLNRKINKVDDNFTDVNSIIQLTVKSEKIVVVTIDSNELYSDDGFVEEEVLKAVSKEINQIEYDHMFLLTHYSILATDECPLKNSAVLIDFVHEHKIEYVFCGHTHDLELMRTTDLFKGVTFNHFRCGSLSSSNIKKDENMFVYYENIGSDSMHLHLIRIFLEHGKVSFKEELIF